LAELLSLNDVHVDGAKTLELTTLLRTLRGTMCDRLYTTQARSDKNVKNFINISCRLVIWCHMALTNLSLGTRVQIHFAKLKVDWLSR
jgi:hypothetical protein